MPDQLAFNNGLVTARDANDLGPGELTDATGIWYKPGDTTRAHKIGGRGEFGTVNASAAVNGLALCLFDDGGTDYLVALSGTSLYRATPGQTGTFAAFVTGLDSNTSSLTSIQADDKWYLATGYDRGYVLKSDGTSRRHGMVSPDYQPVATASDGSAAAATYRPATQSDAGGWTNMNNARDTDDTNYAHATLSAAGSSTGTWTATAGAAGTNDYQLRVKWQLTGYQQPTEGGSGTGGGGVGTGGTVSSGFKVNVSITYSVNGAAAVTLKSVTGATAAMSQPTTETKTLSLAQNDTVAVTVLLTYVSGTSQATLRHYYSKIDKGQTGTLFSTTTGFYYAVTEFDGVNGLESAPSASTALVTFTSKNQVSITLPSAAKNSTTTNYRIYRTYDGGTTPANLGWIGDSPTTETAFVDDFSKGAVDEQPTPIINLVTITVQNPDGASGQIVYARDQNPPALTHLNYYKGSIVGTSTLQPRALYYSEAGALESFPEINVIANFPLPESDRLVATATIGDTLLVAAEGVMITLTDLPRVTNGQFNAAEASPMKGQPGCVGIYALTTFSVAGESRAAWVSPYGVHETNGQQARRISTDQEWAAMVEDTDLSEVVLHWDRNRQVLILCAPSVDATVNNRFWLLHMSPEHEKQVGQPKWTGPHYGSIRCLVSGRYSGVHRLYSGHVSDGNVYLEDYGAVDDSAAYSGSQVPLIVTTGKLYEGYNLWNVYRGNLRHTDFGTSETCTVDWIAGRDAPNTTQTVSKTVSLEDQLGTEFMVARMGEWHQVTITHTGEGQGALQDMRLKAKVAGDAGRVAV